MESVTTPFQVDKLLKTEDGKVSGARVKDMVTGAEWDVKVRQRERDWRKTVVVGEVCSEWNRTIHGYDQEDGR